MRSIIRELWDGNILPRESCQTNTKEMKELLAHISRHHEALDASFSDEQKKIFESFQDSWNAYMSYSEEAIFAYAFKLAARLMLEIQTFEE